MKRELKNPDFTDRVKWLIDTTSDGVAGRFARLTGLTPAGLSKILNSGTRPYRSTIERIAAGTGCSMEWLTEGAGEPFPQGMRPNPGGTPGKKKIKKTQLPIKSTEEWITDSERELLTQCLAEVETYVDDHKIGWSAEMKASVAAMQFHKQAERRLNEKLLTEVIAGVDGFIHEMDIDPPPATKAVLLGLLYARYEPEGHVTPEALQPFLQRVA